MKYALSICLLLKASSGFALEEISDHEFTSRGPVLSLQYQSPLKLSVGAGWVFGTRESVAGSWGAVRKGLVLESKAGLDGGQLGAGYLWESFLVAVPVGFDLKASYLRTWGSQNYFGAELDVMMMFVKLTAGTFYPLSSASTPLASERIWVWGAGLGI